jgi:hypothetical protein
MSQHDLHQWLQLRPEYVGQIRHITTGMELNVPKEVHPLNDAILAAATALSTQALDRRRIVYVISDGKEYGSTAKMGEVIRYLQTNRMEVYGTLVGDVASGVGNAGPHSPAADDARQCAASVCESYGRELRCGVPAEGDRDQLREDCGGGADAVHGWVLARMSRLSMESTGRLKWWC